MKTFKVILSSCLAFVMLLMLKAPATVKAETNSTFEAQLSSLTELGSLTNGNKQVFKNQEPNGNSISLLKDGKEVVYSTGLVTPTRGVVTYSDLNKQGYEAFEAYIGISKSGHSDDTSKVKFQVYGGKKLLYESSEMTSTSEQQHIKINIKGIDVIQLVAVTTSGNNGVLATWADAKFTKSQAIPSLEVSDLEFSSPKQVTKDNILEYAKAFSADGTTDLTSNITYTTNYKEGTAGNYNVVYTVTDPSNNATARRTVKLSVRSTNDYEVNLPLKDLMRPAASYLYHGRNSSSYQAQRAWDFVLPAVLTYNNSDNSWPTISRYGETVVPITFRLQDVGIYISTEDVKYLTSHLMDDEPRTFNLKDWAATCTYKDGIVDTVTVYIGNGMVSGDTYYKTLQKIEENVTMLFSDVKSDMTEAQMLKCVASKYSKWIKYGDGGQLLSNSLGNGVAVCGGNARGYIYLAQRMGVKSHWVRTNNHAWAHSRVDGKWYITDLLAGKYLRAEVDGKPYNSQIYFHRHRNWVPLSPVDYPQDLMNYTS